MTYRQTNPAFHSHCHPFLKNPNPTFLCLGRSHRKPPFLYHPLKFSDLRRRRNLVVASSSAEDPLSGLRLASSVLLFSLSVRLCRVAPAPLLPTGALLAQEEGETINRVQDNHPDSPERFETQEELNAAFEAWKSKTFALSVPLNVVALRGSLPPSWVKDFIQSQGKRLRFCTKFLGNLENIFDDLSKSVSKHNVGPTSAMAADIVTIGDSWLSFAIKKNIIEPVKEIEDQDWYKGLGSQWKVYLRRNNEGKIDPEGEVWAAPYRWGSMVIAYKKKKFQKHKLAPIKDWADLWRPELQGKISMVDSPREVVGAVLKYMGASYNTKDIDLEVTGGRNAVQQNLALLGRQVRLFDSTHYLKAFAVGDVWVAVGWSSDVLPVAKRMSDVAVIIPKSGTSLWADLWAIPAASKLQSDLIGGRVRGPSPVIHQWIEFCLQGMRALPFKQEVVPGATPSALEDTVVENSKEEVTKGNPKLDTNLIAGAPPPEILTRCEFLEPLPDATLLDYESLILGMQKPRLGLIHPVWHHILSTIQTFWPKLPSKVI